MRFWIKVKGNRSWWGEFIAPPPTDQEINNWGTSCVCPRRRTVLTSVQVWLSPLYMAAHRRLKLYQTLTCREWTVVHSCGWSRKLQSLLWMPVPVEANRNLPWKHSTSPQVVFLERCTNATLVWRRKGDLCKHLTTQVQQTAQDKMCSGLHGRQVLQHKYDYYFVTVKAKHENVSQNH